MTLHTRAAVALVYDLVSKESTKSSIRSVRRNADRSLDCPAGLTIAWEKSKAGVVNLVFIAETTELGADLVTHGTAKCMLKFTYPTDGIITLDHLKDLAHQVVEFATANPTVVITETNLDKLYNGET